MGKRRVWSNNDIEEIRRLYIKEGKTLSYIGGVFGTKGDTISKILKSEGVTINRASKNRLFDHDFFESIDSEEKAYYLGLITADGGITLDPKGERSPSVKVELIDRDVLETLSKCTNTGANIKIVNRKGRNLTYLWSVRSEKMAKDLKNLGVVPNKTNTMTGINNNIREDLKRHYIRGLVDGDGSIYLSLGLKHVSFTTKHWSFADEIQNAFKELTGKEDTKKISCYNGVHKITYSGKDAIKLCEVLYEDSKFYIKRKKKLAMEAIEY